MHACQAFNCSNTYQAIFHTYSENNLRLYLGIDVLELVTSIIASLFVCFGLYVFISVPLFHRHLMQLIYSIAANFFGILICRWYILFRVWINGEINSTQITVFSCIDDLKLAEYARFGFMFGYYTALESIIIERFVAIYHLNTYEKNSYAAAIVIGILCQICGILIGGAVLYYDTIDITVLVGMATLANTSFFFFFKRAETLNNKLYSGVTPSKYGFYTLSERFQLSENIRTSQILKKVIVMTFLMNIICQITMITTVLSSNIVVRQAAITTFNFTILAIAILFVVIPMYTIQAWRRKSNEILKTIRAKFGCSNRVNEKIPPPLVLRTLSGNRMIFNVMDERDIYFRSLKTSWNSA